MVIISKLDQLDKVEILANLFKNLILEKIDFNQYSRFCSLTDRIFLEDIEYLVLNQDQNTQVSTEDDRLFVFMGLGLISQRPEMNNGNLIYHYENTAPANMLLDFGFKEPINE